MRERPVQIDYSIREAAAVMAALDLSAHILECCPDESGGMTPDGMRVLLARMKNGIAIARADEALGRG